MDNVDYPMKVYLFGEDGKYDKRDVITINNASELTKCMCNEIRNHILSNLEVRITDPNDYCLFHSMDGKILFPKRED